MKINRYYALHDNDSELKKQGAFAIKLEEANRYNDLGYGIFHTPNDFDGARRKENLIKINYWLADIDEGDKTEQYENILSLIYKPSKIIESKNGFHCYWKAKDATIANYTKIEQGIIQRLKADKGCKDVTRILRAPSFYHWKDKDNPYFVYEVYDFSDKKEYQYSEKTMLTAFAITENKYKYRPFKTRTEIDFGNPENWEKLFKLSLICEGNRNNELTRICYWLRDEGLTRQEIENILLGINSKISSLPETEVRAIMKGKI